jgi:MYXO-CTERM domain-containing protein
MTHPSRPFRPRFPLLPLAVALAVGLGGGRAQASPRHKLIGDLPLSFAPAQQTGRAPLEVVPVVVRFSGAVQPSDLTALEAAGATVFRRRDGRHRGGHRDVAASVRQAALMRVAALGQVTAVFLDRPLHGVVSPLDHTAVEVEATAVWNTVSEAGLPVTGHGVTVCDMDAGIDVFHPLLWRADGGYFDWHDLDGDGIFTPGIDGVDLDGDGIPTAVLHIDAATFNGSTMTPESLAEGYQIGRDWLFVDDNGNGSRDEGRLAGYDDQTPTLGERWLSADDVNGNGLVDVGERLVALGTSKIKSVMWGGVIYRRGENLVDVPRDNASHGTAVSGVLVGGTPGLNRYVGLVPDAELVVGAFGNNFVGELVVGDFCLEEGARVVVHEYAPWFGHFLDGSSPMEQLIDESSGDGVAHINPVGNLGGSDKQYKRLHPSGERTTIEVDNPFDDPEAMLLTVLWREPNRPLSFELELPDGQFATLSGALGPQQIALGGVNVFANRSDSERGTAMLDLQVTALGGMPTGVIQLHVDDGGPATEPPLSVVAYVADSNVSWSSGMHFEANANEEHLLCYPSTADSAIAVAAYIGNGHKGGTPGALADSSGRGVRIDGLDLMSIAAPNDPITAMGDDSQQGAYRVFGGTSGAAPHVAAAAAMLLQLDPSRDGASVRDAIRQGAYVDAAVGNAPNTTFGFGKLRIHQTLYGEPPPVGQAPSIQVLGGELSAGETGRVALAITGASLVELDRDYDGTVDETIDADGFDVTFDLPGIYYAKLRAVAPTGHASTALVPMVVGDAVQEPTPPPSKGKADEAGGCQWAAARQEPTPWSWLAVAGLALAGARRRRRSR